jgi:hypothetical protein
MRRAVEGPLAWTFPASVILATLTAWGWIMFALISRSSPPACELLERTSWLAAAALATAACLYPLTLIGRVWLRIATSLVLAAVGAAAAWWLTAALFPRFC